MTESIKELVIKDQQVEAKGSFLFGERAKEYATKDKDGNETPGINAIYLGLVQRRTDALLNFWDCATAHVTRFKKSDIQKALAEVIDEKEDTIELIRGAIEVLEGSGYFKQEIRGFWLNVRQSYKQAKPEDGQTKEEAKEAAKESAQSLVDMYEAVMDPAKEAEAMK